MPVRSLRSLSLMFVLGLCMALHAGNAAAATYKILHQFCAKRGGSCPDGFGLSGPLVRDAQGNLYGTAYQGGKFGGGTLYRLHPTAAGDWKFDVLHDFCAQADCADGLNPQSSLVIDREGRLYGVTTADASSEARDAIVYRLTPRANRWDYEIIHRFCTNGVCDGEFVNAGLAYMGQATGAPYNGATPLFGVAPTGGANHDGLVYMLTPRPGRWKQTDLYSFCALADCSDGGSPSQPLLVQDLHHIAGVAASGGPTNSGVVFQLTSQDGTTWSESVLHAFCSLAHCADGSGFASGLATDAAGNLYGTTPTGGRCDADFRCGTIFRISPAGTETVVFDFCRQVGGCKVGSDPEAGVAVGADGTLYGTTRAGGTQGAGVIYAFSRAGMKRLHSFCNKGCEGGGNSRSPVIVDPQGRLFGVTPEVDRGGEGGVVYELDP